MAITEAWDKAERLPGCCRVHGGGFAGVIMSIIPKAHTKEYVEYIAHFVGKSNVYPMQIRAAGAIHVEA